MAEISRILTISRHEHQRKKTTRLVEIARVEPFVFFVPEQ
jgi:hypothetical protein